MTAMMTAQPSLEDNSYAGQGSVLLDIGGDIGALVVTMPRSMEGIEIEIRPAGQDHAHDEHGHTHEHDHHHPGDEHGHDGHHHPHVGVVARPGATGPAYTAVFPELREGRYELYEKLGGPVRLMAEVVGGQVRSLDWPTD
jgi:hypothetical protein